MNKFGAWILEELEKKGWTQSELARRMSTNRGTVSNVINGRRNPGPDFCRDLAYALGHPPELAFRMAGLLPTPSETTEAKSLKEMIELARMLTPTQREDALNYIRYLLFEKRQKPDPAAGQKNDPEAATG